MSEKKSYNTPSMFRSRIASLNNQTRKVNHLIALLRREEAAIQKLQEAHKRLQGLQEKDANFFSDD
jgi:hypothetical protein